MAAEANSFTYAVVGGGIAGVTCTETLSSLCTSDQSVLLLSASPIIKAVTNLKQLTRTLHEFEVEERPSSDLVARCCNITVLHETVVKFDSKLQEIMTSSGTRYRYDKLCLCMGGKPKLIASDNPYVLGIRDTETIVEFLKKLSSARRLVIVGNGGIATELVYRIGNCDVVWAIKDKSVISTFVDAGAAKFFLPHIGVEAAPPSGPVKRTRYQLTDEISSSLGPLDHHATGAALGPDWTNILPIRGLKEDLPNIHIEYEVEIRRFITADEFTSAGLTAFQTDSSDTDVSWPVYVELTNGRVFGCDFVVSATGVIPNIWPFVDDCSEFVVAEDGGLAVDGKMKTSVANVYAAGDACTAAWEHSPFWIQMRLWNQARQMGCHAAHCMAAAAASSESVGVSTSAPPSDFAFELFAHVTKFFGFKVVLLGRFNGQGLDNDYELMVRVTEGQKYVKAVMRNGRMVGAVLIGETDLEETFENLILNQLDLSVYGEELLSQDIEDFFD